MNKKTDKPPLQVLFKYFLLQLPGQAVFILILVLARQWLEVPAYLMWGLIGFWAAKDVFLFPSILCIDV